MNSKTANKFLFPIALGSTYLYNSTFINSSVQTDYATEYINNCLITAVVGLTLIYFCLDFILMILRYKPAFKPYFFHHLIGISSTLIGYYYYNHMIRYLFAYLMYEWSTIFLNISMENHKNKIQNYKTVLIELLFLALYTGIRIIFGTVLSIELCTSLLSSSNLFTKMVVVMPILLQVLNYYWYYRIWLMFYRKYYVKKLI